MLLHSPANAFLFLMARCNIFYFTPLNCTVVKPPCERIFRFSIHTFYMGKMAWEIAMTAPVVMALLFPKVTNNTFETKWKLSSFVSCILNSFDALIIYTKSLKSKTSRVSLVIISLYIQDSFFPITKMYSKLFQFLSESCSNQAQVRINRTNLNKHFRVEKKELNCFPLSVMVLHHCPEPKNGT